MILSEPWVLSGPVFYRVPLSIRFRVGTYNNRVGPLTTRLSGMTNLRQKGRRGRGGGGVGGIVGGEEGKRRRKEEASGIRVRNKDVVRDRDRDREV